MPARTNPTASQMVEGPAELSLVGEDGCTQPLRVRWKVCE